VADHAPDGRQAGLTGPDEAAARLEAGRWLFAQDCRFLRGVTDLAQLPEAALPEVAFAGRSNVGKSSLVNALTGRTTLARTSNTPGRTQELNFFDLGGRLILVDLPGYGFAAAPKPKVKAWQGLLDGYLRGRPTLRRALILIDARHGPKDSDRALMDRLGRAAVVFQVVLTKADLVKPAELAARHEALAAELAKRTAAYPAIAVTSARSGSGFPDLRATLAELAG
jgi:GTP-binding protein